MSKRFVRGLMLFILVLGIAATVLVWDSEDTTSEAGCLRCFSATDCSSVPLGTPCSPGTNCRCWDDGQGCGVICTNMFP